MAPLHTLFAWLYTITLCALVLADKHDPDCAQTLVRRSRHFSQAPGVFLRNVLETRVSSRRVLAGWDELSCSSLIVPLLLHDGSSILPLEIQRSPDLRASAKWQIP
jgi:hypothetical protein